MWISRGEYRRLLRQLARSEQRAAADRASLDIERHENSRMLRHMTNMFLRARQIGAYPLPDKPAAKIPEVMEEVQPAIDPGELAAVIAAGEQYGVSPRDAENLLRAEKGLPPI